MLALTTTHHDPDGLLQPQIVRMLPVLQQFYPFIGVAITSNTAQPTLDFLQQQQVHLCMRDANTPADYHNLGYPRRLALELALQAPAELTHIHFCDFDRMLHWAEYQLDDLRTTLDMLVQYDFTVLGRTPRAFASHPRAQCDTEAVINQIFCLASGKDWDVTAASRGLSRRAARAILDGSADITIGNDCSWPLFLQQAGTFTLGYRETEGLEFETPDRYPHEVAAVGGVAAWVAQLDQDPYFWAARLNTARVEADAVIAFLNQR